MTVNDNCIKAIMEIFLVVRNTRKEGDEIPKEIVFLISQELIAKWPEPHLPVESYVDNVMLRQPESD